jgi:hypothetical protein
VAAAGSSWGDKEGHGGLPFYKKGKMRSRL